MLNYLNELGKLSEGSGSRSITILTNAGEKPQKVFELYKFRMTSRNHSTCSRISCRQIHHT